MLSEMAKIGIVSLIIVRFSIRNHRWKAGNLSFLINLSVLTLLERPAPLLGRLRYLKLLTQHPLNIKNFHLYCVLMCTLNSGRGSVPEIQQAMSRIEILTMYIVTPILHMTDLAHIFSQPVLLHGGLLRVAFCLYLDQNSLEVNS